MSERAIWLRTVGADIVVAVQVGHGWVEVIRTHREGEISHIVEQSGINDAVTENLVDKVQWQIPMTDHADLIRRLRRPFPHVHYDWDRLALEAADALEQAEARVRELEAKVWDDLRGSAPDATGDLSSEEFVRELRDAWEL